MKTMTVRQPWADAITYLGKTTENRTRRTTYRGPLLIHAGKAADRTALDLAPITGNLPDARGAIIATAELTDCHRDTGCCRPWGEPDTWHWRLAHVQPLSAPVPCPGALGLWTPPPAVLHALTTRPTGTTHLEWSPA